MKTVFLHFNRIVFQNIYQAEKMFIPMEASHHQKRPSANNIHSRKSNLSGASIDEQIRHLHKTRNNLLHLREQINNKLKKVSEIINYFLFSFY